MGGTSSSESAAIMSRLKRPLVLVTYRLARPVIIGDICHEFRLRRAGVVIDRVAFPQLPWAILKDPQFLKTANGGTLLVDGWYQYCRKPHYMADILQALCWGLICGFEVLLPYWYVCFFVPMIIHRAVRDDARCAEKYGKDWDTYIGRVPYVFVPGVV